VTSSWPHRCLALFPETVQERHGWRPDYAGLEKLLEPVGAKQREFSYRDLETIQNGRFWDFRQFWRFPAQSDLQREVDFPEMSRLLHRLPLDESQSIARLHAAFKYIENVSVILRFVHPAHYGILSPPVEKVLEVRRGRTEIETYLSYLRDLREVKDHYGLPRAADADMALWVLQERVLSSFRDHDLLREFRADAWFLRRRAVNLLAELGEVTGAEDPLDLARALVDANVALAGILAGAALERALWSRAGGRAGRATGLAELVERLAVGQPRDMVEGWRRAIEIRDRFLHGPGESLRPTRREAIELIEQTEKVREVSS